MKGEEILMNDFNMKIPTFKELEQTFFALLSNIFVEEFVDYLHMVDEKIMELRDKNRYRLKDHRERTIQTLFGDVTLQRRLYEDRKTGQTVYLLDQYLSIEERKPISPHLEEWAIRLAAEGTSYIKSGKSPQRMVWKPIFLTKLSGKS